MPVVTAAASIPVIAATMWSFVCWLVIAAAPADPGGTIFAVLGAGPASVMVLLEARAKGRSLADTARVFLGSGAIGMFGPGITLWALRVFTQWIPASALPLPWEVVAGAGFVFSLFGWPFLLKLNRWFENRTDSVLHLNSARYQADTPFDNPEPRRQRRD